MPKLSLVAFVSLMALAQADNNITDNNNTIEMMGAFGEGTATTAHVRGDVLSFYQNSVLKSDSAFYDKNSTTLTLDGNIESIGYQSTKEMTNHMVLNSTENNATSDALFLTNDNDVWMYSDNSKKCGDLYFLGNSIISSCSIKNPLWKLVFNNSIYDDKSKIIKLYGAKMYFWDVPIFYFPYLSLTTDNKRKSGLLYPKFGYNSTMGFLYEQPIFIAPYDNWDVELNPQMRTIRGNGLYGTLRFVDTPYSQGEIRAGIFEDSQSYYKSHNLSYQNHYGVEGIYSSSKIFDLPFNLNDGLYLNAIYLNDIDYLNLQKSQIEHFGITNFQESRANYFASNEDYYFGLNAKYYQDTTKVSNSSTLQVLPSIDIHNYYTQLFDYPIFYSADATYKNYYRPQGSTLQSSDITIPFEYSTSFFNDYLRVSVGEDLYATKLLFGNVTSGEDNLSFASNTNRISLSTDLTKKYDDFTHVVQPSITYTNLGFTSRPVADYSNIGLEQQKLYPYELPREQVGFALSHYLYDNKDVDVSFYERLGQIYYPKDGYKYGDLSHEIGLNYANFRISNEILYSNEFSKFRSIYTTSSWSNDLLSLGVSHTYKKNVIDELNVLAVANDLGLNANVKVSNYLSLFGNVNYQLDGRYSNLWRLGIDYTKECFGFSFTLSNTVIPTLTNSGTSYMDSKNFYLQFKFIPFATVGSR